MAHVLQHRLVARNEITTGSGVIVSIAVTGLCVWDEEVRKDAHCRCHEKRAVHLAVVFARAKALHQVQEQEEVGRNAEHGQCGR
eukprot:1324426-Pleurochrysis_carterae.AAC.1